MWILNPMFHVFLPKLYYKGTYMFLFLINMKNKKNMFFKLGDAYDSN